MSGLLNDKVILVTGGSRGIGRAVVEVCASNGAKVIFTYNRSEEEAQALRSKLTEEGFESYSMQVDVIDPDSVKKLFHYIKERFGRLDVLVNNAGVVSNNLLLMTTDSEYQKVVDTNCRGSFLCMRSAVKMMMPKKTGKIINMASIVGVHGNSGQIAYSASKAFIIGMTKAAAKELGPQGISVNAIAPGFIDTDMTRNLKDEIKADLLSNVSLGRVGTPKDVANAVLFLSSYLSDYISGQVIGVDGCQSM